MAPGVSLFKTEHIERGLQFSIVCEVDFLLENIYTTDYLIVTDSFPHLYPWFIAQWSILVFASLRVFDSIEDRYFYFFYYFVKVMNKLFSSCIEPVYSRSYYRSNFVFLNFLKGYWWWGVTSEELWSLRLSHSKFHQYASHSISCELFIAIVFCCLFNVFILYSSITTDN